MGDLTKNFSRAEFSCRCGCGFDVADFSLVEMLQSIADRIYEDGPQLSGFGTYCVVTSGCRCPAHNRAVGGAEHSQHLLGRAADMQFFHRSKDGSKGTIVSVDTVYSCIKKIDFKSSTSVGVYDSFIHIDSRTGGPKFWDYRS